MLRSLVISDLVGDECELELVERGDGGCLVLKAPNLWLDKRNARLLAAALNTMAAEVA